MVTIFDVAKEAGVSVVTVSRLMNNPRIVSVRTAEKVYAVIERLNYQPSQLARSLVGKKTNTIGVIMPDLQSTFFNSWYRYIEDVATARGINLLLCNTDEDAAKEMQYVKLLHSKRVDGVIIVPHSAKSVEYLTKVNMRFILFDREFKDTATSVVTSDHYQGAFDAMEYLIQLGHRRIAILKGPGVIFADRERFAAYKDALKKHHLRIDADLVRNCELTDTGATQAVVQMLRKKTTRPTAIFSVTHLMTEGAIKGVRAMGMSIPEDVSLLSCDAISGQEIFIPRITHVLQAVKALGKEVMVALLHGINDTADVQPQRIVVKPKLVLGESCRRIEGETVRR